MAIGTTAISDFFGRLFGTEKALNTIIEGASNGLDKLVHTGEEKSEEAARDRSEARKMVIEWLKNTQGQNLSRRLIALSITFVWLGSYLFGRVTAGLAIFTNNSGAVTSEKLILLAEQSKETAHVMNPAVMLILAFYFAAPHMGEIVKGAFSRIQSKDRN